MPTSRASQNSAWLRASRVDMFCLSMHAMHALSSSKQKLVIYRLFHRSLGMVPKPTAGTRAESRAAAAQHARHNLGSRTVASISIAGLWCSNIGKRKSAFTSWAIDCPTLSRDVLLTNFKQTTWSRPMSQTSILSTQITTPRTAQTQSKTAQRLSTPRARTRIQKTESLSQSSCRLKATPRTQDVRFWNYCLGDPVVRSRNQEAFAHSPKRSPKPQATKP